MTERRKPRKPRIVSIHHLYAGVSLYVDHAVGVVHMSDPKGMGLPPLRMGDFRLDFGWGDIPGLSRLELSCHVLQRAVDDLERQGRELASAGGPGAPEGATGGVVQDELPLVWFDGN